MQWTDLDEDELETGEVLRLILAELRETNDKLSEIHSELLTHTANLDDTQTTTEGSGSEIAAAIKSTGFFTIALLGMILWKLW